MKTKLRALGIMNGTSLDGIDYSLIEINAKTGQFHFIKHKQLALPKKIKASLLEAAQDNLKVSELAQLHFALGKVYAQQVKKLSWKWDLAGLHGQTVFHHGKIASLQIGNPAFLATSSSKPVVFDFRSNDIAVDGQGAPFAPFFQRAIFAHMKPAQVAFHNLGGISNVTLLKKGTSKSRSEGQRQNRNPLKAKVDVKGWDTGPANILMDSWIFHKTKGKMTFDKNGKLAHAGIAHWPSLEKFLKHPYFKKKAPKSCGREQFNFDFIQKKGGKTFLKLSLEDQMATLLELTAQTIAKDYKKVNSELPIYFYGGGVNNKTLMKRLKVLLHPHQVLSTEDLGWPPQAFESSAFAYLAALRVLEKSPHIPAVTGAKKETLLGSIALG